MNYRYSIYGLTIGSDFNLEGALPSVGGEDDLQIVSGEIDLESFPPPQKKRTFVGDGKQCLLLPRAPDQIALLVSKSRITVPLPLGRDLPLSTQQRIMASALAAANYLRDRTILHACAVSDGQGNAVAFVGRSGAGKSTMAQALQHEGGALLSDDHCVIELPNVDLKKGASLGDDGRGPLVFPGVPQAKLKDGHPLAVGLKPVAKLENEKNLFTAPKFEKELCRLRAVYVLRESSDDAIAVEEIANDLEKVTPLLRYRFRSGFIEELGLESSQMDVTRHLSSTVPVYRLYRPMDFSRVQEVASFVFNHAFGGK